MQIVDANSIFLSKCITILKNSVSLEIVIRGATYLKTATVSSF